MSLEPKNRPWWPLIIRLIDANTRPAQDSAGDDLIHAIDKLQSDRDALLDLLNLIRRGLANGTVRAKPIIDMSDPNAEEWPINSLGELIDKAITEAERADSRPP